MKILLDEMMPRPLKHDLREHDVFTVQEMDWAGVKNGALIQFAVSAGFRVLLTVDQNLPYQQDVPSLGLAVLVLAVGGDRLQDLRPAVPRILTVIASEPQPGTVTIIGER